MSNAGFKREITGSNGKTYSLPNATYVSDTDKSVDDVRDEVKKIADSVQSKSSVIVFERKGNATWIGLDEIKPSAKDLLDFLTI